MQQRGSRRGGYAWVVVAVVTAMMAVTSGTRFLFGVVLKPVSEEFGWNRSDLSLAVTINVIILTFMQPLVGMSVDRWGARRVLLPGVIGTALLCLPITFATSLWQIYLIYGLVAALSFAAMSPINVTKLVSGWFTERRGLALSISSSGAAIGQLAIIPIATWIMLHYGWRTSYWVLAVVVIVLVLPLCWGFVRDPKQPVGDRGADADDAAKISIARAIRIPAFWQITFGLFVCGYTMGFTQVHMIPYLLDMPEHSLMTAQATASTAMSVVGGCSVLGSFLCGLLADRLGARPMLAMTYFLRGLSYLILLLAGPNLPLIFVAAIVMGVSWTSTTPLSSVLLADIFGQASLGTIFAFSFTAMNIGVGAGSFLAGKDFDLAQNYHFALIADALIGFVAAGIIQVVRVRPLVAVPASRQPTLAGAD